MRCPSCESVLRPEKVDYVTFDICPACRGIWVSGEQFRALAVKVATEGQVPSSVKLTFERRTVLKASPDNPVRDCPTCQKPMREFNYAYDSNVFLDRCEQCKGIWLDANEIIDIAAYIQYNPQAEAIGRDLVKGSVPDDGDDHWGYILAGAALGILRALVFRR